MKVDYATIASSNTHEESRDMDAYGVIAVDWKGEDEVAASKEAIQEAKRWSLENKKILWNLDLSFETGDNLMEDEVLFHSRRVLVEYFAETALTEEGIETFGVSLYTGHADFEHRLIWTENIEEHYEELLRERRLEKSPHQTLWKRGYALEILAEYLHKLGSYLKDDISLFCSLDASMLKSPAEVLYLLSKERFLHLDLILKGCALPMNSYSREYGLGSRGGWDQKIHFHPQKAPVIGFVNPSIECWDDQVVESVSHVIAELENKLIEYRIVSEATLTEEWDGLEVLVVIGAALTSSGKRKLQGYIASGGEIVLYGEGSSSIQSTPFLDWIGSKKKKSE